MSLAADAAVATAGEIMLFGVRVVVDSMRKSVSMNNLSQYEHTTAPPNSANKNDAIAAAAAGYSSADDAILNISGRNRRRGIPWTEEEHKLFLLGLQKVGKGDWRGISRNYVKTRTPTQVASHAQKYFLRRTNLNRRRRRSSLFDITTATVSSISTEEEQIQHQDNVVHPHYPVSPATQPESNNLNVFPVMPVNPTGLGSGAILVQSGNPMEKLTLGQGKMEQNEPTEMDFTIPVVQDPRAPMVRDINSGSSSSAEPQTLSLGLSLSSSRLPNLHTMPCFNNGDSIISVAL